MAVYKNQDKAKVGDYVKIIKKLPYKDQKYDVDIGDIGIVNYVASTGKYSVHIDGKKNPHDLNKTQKRICGELYDFWIPCNCCEVINNFKFKIGEKVRINYPQAIKVHNCIGTIVKPNHEISNFMRYVIDILNVDKKVVRISLSENCLEKVSDTTYEEELTKKCLFENADALDDGFLHEFEGEPINFMNYLDSLNDIQGTINSCEEREEKKMKEIKNQKVVDLYFKRKKQLIEEDYRNERKNIVEADKHQIFVTSLMDHLKTYIDDNEDLDVKIHSFLFSLPLCPESINKENELSEKYQAQFDMLKKEESEVLAMLSGCEIYEQEMVILKSYGIVDENNKIVNVETN